MFRHPQELIIILHKIKLDLYMILHHSLLSLNIQIKQFDLKTITINKLLTDIMTHSIIPFIHTLVQIPKRTIIKTIPKIAVILI